METHLHSNLILYAKSHYPQIQSRFRDVQVILKHTFPDENITPEKTLRVLSALAYKAIQVDKDPLQGFISATIFLYNARESVAKELSNLEDCIEELLAQTLLARIACATYSNLGQVDEKIVSALYSCS